MMSYPNHYYIEIHNNFLIIPGNVRVLISLSELKSNNIDIIFPRRNSWISSFNEGKNKIISEPYSYLFSMISK